MDNKKIIKFDYDETKTENLTTDDRGEPENGDMVTSSGRKRRSKRDGLHSGKRSRYFSLLLWCDNPEHMEVYDWITKEESYISILHEPEEDDRKPHYHVILHFQNARTLNGVEKYFNHQVDRFVRICNDPYAFAQYMLHNTFECKKKQKKRYSLSDVNGTGELIRLLYPVKKLQYTETILVELLNIIETRQVISLRSLIKILIRTKNSILLEYVTSHSFFVKSLLLDPAKFNGYGEKTVEQENDEKNLPVSPYLKDIYDRHFADTSVQSDTLVPDFICDKTQDVKSHKPFRKRKKR